MLKDELKPNAVVEGPFFPEAVQVLVVVPIGSSVKLIGRGKRTNQAYDPVLNEDQIASLVASPTNTTPIFPCRLRASTRFRISSKRSTTISCASRVPGFYWQTIREPARPSWPGC